MISKKIGLFFGSFNPITTGHISVARAALEQTDLDELWITVSPNNPAKMRKGILADGAHRLEMGELAVKNEYGLEVSDIEFKVHKPGEPSFTHYTLRKLRTERPDDEFIIVCGSDIQQMIAIWRSSDEITEHHKTIHYPRPFKPRIIKPGSDAEARYEKILDEAIDIDAPEMDISSTLIRSKIKSGESLEGLVHTDVEKYIKENNLFE